MESVVISSDNRGPRRSAARHVGYFTPESAVWRIGREAVLMLGGGRALLMQAAHPLVAAGIVAHSRYRDDPWRRLARTMTALYTIVYGTKTEADLAGASVQAVHRRVRGRIAEAAGPFGAGTPYAADDPELQLWVYGTLVTTGLAMHETFVGRLDAGDREAFYADMTLVARIFGVRGDVLPATLADFREYERGRLDSGAICLTAAARDIAGAVLAPALPLPLRHLLRPLNLATVGLLPPEVREVYGLRFGPVHRVLLAASSTTTKRAVLPLLPGPLRLLAPADEAERKRTLPLALLAALAH